MKPALQLRLGGATARAQLVGRGGVRWAGEAPFTTPQELEEAVCQLAAAEGLPVRPKAMRVELEQPLVQVRTLRDLPPVRTAQLKSLVATQSARFFRRNGKPLATDACWQSRGRHRAGTALAAAAEEPWLEAIIGGARTAGIVVERIHPADLPAGANLDLLPQAERRRRLGQALVSVRRLAAVASLAWVAAGGVYLGRLGQQRAAVAGEIARLEGAASAVGNARRALRDAAATVETLDRAARERGSVIGRLAALGALPDSAFLTAAEIDAAGRGRLSAVARSSADVLAALDRSGRIVSARVDGGVAREALAGRDWERFAVEYGPEASQ